MKDKGEEVIKGDVSDHDTPERRARRSIKKEELQTTSQFSENVGQANEWSLRLFPINEIPCWIKRVQS